MQCLMSIRKGDLRPRVKKFYQCYAMVKSNEKQIHIGCIKYCEILQGYDWNIALSNCSAMDRTIFNTEFNNNKSLYSHVMPGQNSLQKEFSRITTIAMANLHTYGQGQIATETIHNLES